MLEIKQRTRGAKASWPFWPFKGIQDPIKTCPGVYLAKKKNGAQNVKNSK